MTLTKTRQQAFAFGAVFVVVMLVLAVLFPEPTPFQYEVFKIVLAIAVAGVAAMIPGFLNVEVGNVIRAGGAIAVFVIIYFFSPAQFVAKAPENNPTDPVSFYIIRDAGNGGLVLDSYTLPLKDVEALGGYSDIVNLIDQFAGIPNYHQVSKIFRMNDERALEPKANYDATSGGNMGLLVMPLSFIDTVGDEHVAFTCVKDAIDHGTNNFSCPSLSSPVITFASQLHGETEAVQARS
jgi:hypothetical protein